MDLDALLTHYLGTADIAQIDDAALSAGEHRLAVDFGTERDPGRRFALWALMHGLGIAPNPRDAFKTQREIDAATTYARIAGQTGQS